MSTESRSLTIFAPAKLNLNLHITGRRADGYHTLDSLVTFTDIGDEITIRPAIDFKLTVTGPFAGSFNARDRDSSPNSGNLVVRAVWKMAEAARKTPDFEIILSKNLPLASGIGGGSADAAAAIWGMLEWWHISRQAPFLNELMRELGADVPVCLECQSRQMLGIGELLNGPVELPEIPVVLANPGKPCSTAQVFSLFSGPYKSKIVLPENITERAALINFLQECDNDLEEIACDIVPDIRTVMNSLENSHKPLLQRMAGAGATCFALYESYEDALTSAEALKEAQPHWWVRTGWIGRPQRY